MRGFRRLFAVGGVVVLAGLAGPAAAQHKIDGVWRLDEKNSRNVPDALKGIDLKIVVRGRQLSTQHLFDGAPVGDPFVVTLDGVPAPVDLGKGRKATVTATWKEQGRIFQQVIKTTQGMLDVVQTTMTTVSDDGQVMYRNQVQKAGPEETVRELVYRKK